MQSIVRLINAGWLVGLAVFCAALLAGCLEEDTTSISYLGVNHTDQSVVAFTINGEGGILNVPAQGGGGGQVCCVTLPTEWRPDLKVTIRWQNDGEWLLDANGKEVIRNGKKVFVSAPWKEKTVAIPPYRAHEMQHFDVHFLPQDDIKVLVGDMRAVTHRQYPVPYPVSQDVSK